MKRLSLSTIILCVALTTACGIHKVGGAVTPWERVTTENAILAQLIQTANQGTQAVQASGLINAAQAAPVLNYFSQAADVQTKLNNILAQAPVAANIPQIQALVNQISLQAKDLITSGALGVKNPKSQQTIGMDVQAIVNSANLIFASYQVATGGK